MPLVKADCTYCWVTSEDNKAMRISIQSSPTSLNLIPPQDRQIHLRFFDTETNKPIEKVTFNMIVTKGTQIFLQNNFWTQSGNFTFNLKPGERYLWTANPDHDPMDGLYYSKGDKIDIWTSYLTEDTYHFLIQPLVYAIKYTGQQNDGMKFETDLDLLDSYNKTIFPDVYPAGQDFGLQSPLKQFKSGMAASKVVCRQEFQLILKREDGSSACVKPDTASILVERGWAKEIVTTSQTSFNQNYNSTRTYLPASFVACDTPFTKSNSGIAVLYMSMNSIGKICVHYTNWNKPTQGGIRIFEANDLTQGAKTITISGSDTIPTGNSTLVYTINSGNKAGFYGMSFFCGGIPFAVGYDNQSRIVSKDFPWLGESFMCPMMSFNYDITGMTGIGVKYIPYPAA